MNILIEKLKNIVSERRSEGTPDNAIINTLKEELQYAVLDFIYNNRAYSHLIMYGGTLLRIGYGLPRMSEDLDFQTNKHFDFHKFNKDIAAYFKAGLAIDIAIREKSERLTGTDFAIISFPGILEGIGMKGHGVPTVLKIRFDVNVFSRVSDFASETIPVTRGTYAFAIRTYPLSTLMASKIAAVLLRTKRGIGNEMSDCKPRDIFDLMWYMEKKILPDMDYLRAIHARGNKEMAARNVLELFDALTKRVLNLDDKLFTHDLAPLFFSPLLYDDWHRDWKRRFTILRNSYEIYEVKQAGGRPDLQEIYVATDFSSDNRYFHFYFATEESAQRKVKFTFILSEYWYKFTDFKIPSGHRNKDIEDHIKGGKGSGGKLTELDYEYAGLFYEKITDYLKRNDYVVLQPEIKTKLIRATAENLNVKTQVVLDRRLLLKEKLEGLM